MAQRQILLYLIPQRTLSPAHGRTLWLYQFSLHPLVLPCLLQGPLLTKASPQLLLQHLSALNSYTVANSGVPFETQVQASGCSVAYYKLWAVLI